MLEAIKNAFKTKEIRSKILFTVAMIVVIRLGTAIPIPGMDLANYQNWYQSLAGEEGNNLLGLLDRFTGGSFERMSVFALNITPYITASIIIQLLTIAIPALEEMQRDGEEGRKKLTKWTRFLTVGLAILEGGLMAYGFYNSTPVEGEGFLIARSPLLVVQIVAALTAGSAFLMWVGERITEKGVGNGISVVLGVNIISRMPADFMTLFRQFVFNNTVIQGILITILILAIVIAMVVLVVILNSAERRIPVQYAKKMQGRRMMGGNTAEIPLKVNTAGVMPVIFAMSLFQFPIIISQFAGYEGPGTWQEILNYLNQNMWVNPAAFRYTLGLLAYIGLMIFFAYFYTSVTFNPLEIADNMKKQGGFIPGIRPGKPTSDYLAGILKYIIFIGAAGLVIVAVVPIIFNGLFNANVSFGGTSLIIVVSVILDTLKQIESQLVVRNYKGFLEG
ncbi:MAG: preprotein translocase subunit SecY [Lachnospiraceae bacterium]|nr:preprotein translocase subunit SecY [Lachnospiraceae bacterium]